MATPKHVRFYLLKIKHICEHLNKGVSKWEIAHEYNIGKPTVSGIYKIAFFSLSLCLHFLCASL